VDFDVKLFAIYPENVNADKPDMHFAGGLKMKLVWFLAISQKRLEI